MNAEHSLLIQGINESKAKDLVEDFGFVVTESMPAIAMMQAKDPVKTDWPDEHGEDVYIPQHTAFKAISFTIPVGYNGAKGSASAALRALQTYLSTIGSITLYNEQRKGGYTECSFNGCDEPTISTDMEYDILETKLKFTAHDPVSEVVARKVNNHYVLLVTKKTLY